MACHPCQAQNISHLPQLVAGQAAQSCPTQLSEKQHCLSGGLTSCRFWLVCCFGSLCREWAGSLEVPRPFLWCFPPVIARHSSHLVSMIRFSLPFFLLSHQNERKQVFQEQSAGQRKRIPRPSSHWSSLARLSSLLLSLELCPEWRSLHLRPKPSSH